MKNIMLDLETMGNGPQSAIVAIGAVYFDEQEFGDTFYRKVSLDSSIKAGLKVDASTIIWWLKQSEDARGELTDEQTSYSLCDVLFELKQFFKQKTNIKVWGNGAGFDNVILRSAYEVTNQKVPWEFWNDRCFRTIRNIFRIPGYVRPEKYLAHHALHDAMAQAEELMCISRVHNNFLI